MSANREMLEDHLEKYEAQLRSLNSYIKELNDKTAEHGTDKEHFEVDLREAEHNVQYYENEITRIKSEIGRPGQTQDTKNGADTVLPRTAKQGIGALIVSSISFLAGALVGSKLKSRRPGKDPQD